MSINKMEVSELTDLKNVLLKHGSDYFYWKYSKPDVLIGPPDSIDFITIFMKEYLD